MALTLKLIAELTGFNRITLLKRSGKLKCVMIQPASYAWSNKEASQMAKHMAKNLKQHGIVRESSTFQSVEPKSKNGWVSNILTIIGKWDGD